MRVSIRELKARLSEYLSRARSGELIEVTSHRKIVARLVGVPATEDEGLQRLLASGTAQWGGGKPAGAAIRFSGTGRSVSDMILEDRG